MILTYNSINIYILALLYVIKREGYSIKIKLKNNNKNINRI